METTGSAPRMHRVQVVVLCQNRQEKFDVFTSEQQATTDEVRGGVHFVRANSQAAACGLRPMMAMDESHPLWKVVMDGKKFASFFDDATVVLQDSIAGREVDPKQTKQDVQTLYEPYHDEELHLAISTEGYWSNSRGWVDNPEAATLFRRKETLQRLRARGPVCVASYPIGLLARTGLRDFPRASELVTAAREAFRIARLTGHHVDETNAERILRYQLEAERIPVNDHAAKLLGPLMLSVATQQRATEPLRELDSRPRAA